MGEGWRGRGKRGGAPLLQNVSLALKSLKGSGELFPSQQQGDKPPKRKEQRDEVGGPRGEERVQDAALPKRRTEGIHREVQERAQQRDGHGDIDVVLPRDNGRRHEGHDQNRCRIGQLGVPRRTERLHVGTGRFQLADGVPKLPERQLLRLRARTDEPEGFGILPEREDEIRLLLLREGVGRVDAHILQGPVAGLGGERGRLHDALDAQAVVGQFIPGKACAVRLGIKRAERDDPVPIRKPDILQHRCREVLLADLFLPDAGGLAFPGNAQIFGETKLDAAPENAAKDHGVCHHAEGDAPGLQRRQFAAASHDAQLDDRGQQEDHRQDLRNHERHLHDEVGEHHAHGQPGLDEVVETLEQVRKHIQADADGKGRQQDHRVVLGQIAEKQAHDVLRVRRLRKKVATCGVRSCAVSHSP